MPATRERIEKAATRAGFAVTHRGVFDEISRDTVQIIVMYTAIGAVGRAHLYVNNGAIPAASVEPGDRAKAETVIGWMGN